MIALSAHHQPQIQFARSSDPRAAAKAADARPSLLPASAANYHRQHGSTHEWGRGVPELGMLSRASIHADGRRDLQSGFYLSDDCLPERLGRGILLRSFSGRLSGCVNTQLAKPINHPLSAERLKNFAKGPERHFYHLSQQRRAAGVLNGCQHGMPKNWESLPNGGSA